MCCVLSPHPLLYLGPVQILQDLVADTTQHSYYSSVEVRHIAAQSGALL